MVSMNVSDPGQERTDAELRLLLKEGRDLLRSLGRRNLAREFWERGHDLPSREALTELLLDCLHLERRP